MSVYFRAGFIKNSVAAALLLGAMATAIPSHAELIEDSKTVIRFSSSDARWIRPPNFSELSSHREFLHKEIALEVSMTTNKQGDITYVRITTNTPTLSEESRLMLERIVKKAFYRAKVSPFVIDGHAVEGMVTVPVRLQ
ncbi:hypothetical protein [Psychrobacter sp. bablab_jr014]|nr:hypothetical protein [Psychrobacter sp. bablab_jr014]